MTPNASSRASALTPEQHARIRAQIVFIPVYIWLAYSVAFTIREIAPLEPVRDFMHFYVQGALARTHDSAALYDIDKMAAMVPRLVPGAPDTKYPPVYGPQMSVLFAPLSTLPYLEARTTWFAISLVIYVMCTYAIWTACPRLRQRPVTTALLLAAAPALYLMLGFVQISAIGLVCVTAAFLALRKNRPFLAGLAIGSLAYKPPLGLAVAFVFVFAGEWRIVLGAIVAAAAQIGVGVAYWGFSILPAYVRALFELPGVAAAMEPFKYHMHSWKSFLELLGLPAGVALAAYAAITLCVLLAALACWRARGPLALRYSALLLATVLIDPHMYAYDFVLLVPAYMLLWDWVLGEPDRRVADVVPRAPWTWLRRQSFNSAFQWLLYACYFSPLLASIADATRVQLSVPLMTLLGATIFGVLARKD